MAKKETNSVLNRAAQTNTALASSEQRNEIMAGEKRESETAVSAGQSAAGRVLAQRGSLVSYRSSDGNEEEALGIVVSNNVQNEASELLLIVPLQRRISRLKAPFAVDLGREDGLRDLHTVRCDWITKIMASDLIRIERAKFPDTVMSKVESALKVALGFSDFI